MSEDSKKATDLLQSLIDFTNDGVAGWELPRVVDGKIILDNCSMNPTEMEDVRARSRALLESLSRDGDAFAPMLEGIINARGLRMAIVSGGVGRDHSKVGSIVRGDPSGPGAFVPVISRPDDIPFGILALARCTGTGSGDSIADRIAKCSECEEFHLLPTRKPSLFCGDSCRWKNRNRKKQEAGDFRKWYRERTKSQHE